MTGMSGGLAVDSSYVPMRTVSSIVELKDITSIDWHRSWTTFISSSRAFSPCI